MRLSTFGLVLGAVSSTVNAHDQKVLNGDDQSQPSIGLNSDGWWGPLENLWGEASAEVKATWNEISLLVPGALDHFESFKKQAGGTGKSTNRRPDSDHDFHVNGADLDSVWVETDGESHRKVDGDLSNYGLRAKAVDPSKLGVDDVKQYSGYLDEYVEDKHLFYCVWPTTVTDPQIFSVLTVTKGSLSRAMILRTIPSCCG